MSSRGTLWMLRSTSGTIFGTIEEPSGTIDVAVGFSAGGWNLASEASGTGVGLDPPQATAKTKRPAAKAAHRLFIISFNNNLWLDIWFQSIDSMPPVGIRVHVAATPETESHPLFNARKPMLKRGTGWHRRVYTSQTSIALNTEGIVTCLSATSLNGHTKIPSRGSLEPRERHQRPDPQQRRL